jgi:hypothetical protein
MDMLFAPVQGYGMGWFVEQGHIFHGGANETFKTYVDIYPLKRYEHRPAHQSGLHA